MNPLAVWSAIKAGFVWVVLAVLIAGVGVQTLRLSDSVADLANEVASRAIDNSNRTTVALGDALRTSEKTAAHLATQQGLSDELVKETALRIATERSNGRLDGLLRASTAAFLAASDREEAAARTAGGGCEVNRPNTLKGFFAEAGDLLARSVGISEEARSVVQRRDSEVKALKGVVDNDRATVNTD